MNDMRMTGADREGAAERVRLSTLVLDIEPDITELEILRDALDDYTNGFTSNPEPNKAMLQLAQRLLHEHVTELRRTFNRLHAGASQLRGVTVPVPEDDEVQP